jgi:hypothetical protein
MVGLVMSFVIAAGWAVTEHFAKRNGDTAGKHAASICMTVWLAAAMILSVIVL